MDQHSLELLEFGRVTAAIAERARSERGAIELADACPVPNREARDRELELLHEAIRRQQEPGSWSSVGEGALDRRLESDQQADADPAASRLDGPGLVEVRGWLEAAESTRSAWTSNDLHKRFPRLAARVDELPRLDALRERLTAALEPDGRVADRASPKLARLRRDAADGERKIQRQLERWSSGFGDSAYVTRLGDRFVALVPAAGFSRKRGIVHDVSKSGQSLFVEPLEATDANNRLIEQHAAALDEERRILFELADAVLTEADALRRLDDGLIHLDTLYARASWATEYGGQAIRPGGDHLRLRAARHPLLAMTMGPDQLVPLDLELTSEGKLLLVSGPNMGGKTVLLKTVGLSVALAHAAFPIHAGEGSAVPEIDHLVADLGDEQSIDRGLSTFAAHLERLSLMTTHAGPRALLLCDELGAGTDPEEGAALGRALLERFAARGAWAVITTHLGSLKRAAADVPGILNGSLEFDTEAMTPRYRFISGVPGASHALAMAERLGFDAEVVARARAITPEETRVLERWLGELEKLHRTMEDERGRLAEARAEAAAAAARASEETAGARDQLKALRRGLTRDSQAVLGQARELLRQLTREIKRADKSHSSAAQLSAQAAEVERQMEQLETQAQEAHHALGGADERPVGIEASRVEPGLRVRVADLGVEAEVAAKPDAQGNVLLRRANWNIHSHVSKLEPVGEPAGDVTHPNGARTGAAGKTEERPAVEARWDVPDEAAALEVHVRGMDVDEALRELDTGLDRAVVGGLAELRIVHGVGRGILRAAVERHLRTHPQVASQRPGQLGEGGRGVTVASLR